MNANNLLGYGASVATGNLQWAVAGAPDSWAKQGYSVAINRNQNTGSFLQSQLITEVPYRLYQTTASASSVMIWNTGSRPSNVPAPCWTIFRLRA